MLYVFKIFDIPTEKGHLVGNAKREYSYRLYQLSTGQIMTFKQLARFVSIKHQTLRTRVRTIGIHSKRLLLPVGEFSPQHTKGGFEKKQQARKRFNRRKICIRDGIECKKYSECQDMRLFNEEKFKLFYPNDCVYIPRIVRYNRNTENHYSIPFPGRTLPCSAAE